MPASLKLTELIAEAAKQQVKIVAASPDGNFISINECSEKFFKTVKNVYLVGCEKHKFAYSIDDPSAGKISTATLYRRIEKSQSFCALCAQEEGDKIALGHCGARVYDALKNNKALIKYDLPDILPRSELKRDSFVILKCLQCGGNNKKTVKDILESSRRLSHGYELCKKCAQKASDSHLKYTLSDVQSAADSNRVILLSLRTPSGKIVLPEVDDPATKVSINSECKITCSQKSHQSRWRKTTRVATLLSGATGCKVCAAVVTQNEMFAYALINQFIPERAIELFASLSWLGRQHLDLYIKDKRLAIEVDGSQHKNKASPRFSKANEERDARKNKLVREQNIRLIRLDCSGVENLSSTASSRERASVAISHFLPVLANGAPDIFDTKSSCAITLLDKVHDSYLKLVKELIPRIYEEKKQRFHDYCRRVGIKVLGEYLADHLEVKVWCPHEQERMRRPMDIMAGMGKHCCRVSAKGTKASVIRAIELAAERGYLIDFSRSQMELNDERIRATTKFAITCKCGQKYFNAASINALKNGRFGLCTCFEDKQELLDCYEKQKDGWKYNSKIIQVVEPAILRRKKLEKMVRDGEFRLLEYTLEHPKMNRKKMVRMLNNEGYKITEHRIRTIWQKLNMRARETIPRQPLSQYAARLKELHASESNKGSVTS